MIAGIKQNRFYGHESYSTQNFISFDWGYCHVWTNLHLFFAGVLRFFEYLKQMISSSSVRKIVWDGYKLKFGKLNLRGSSENRKDVISKIRTRSWTLERTWRGRRPWRHFFRRNRTDTFTAPRKYLFLLEVLANGERRRRRGRRVSPVLLLGPPLLVLRVLLLLRLPQPLQVSLVIPVLHVAHITATTTQIQVPVQVEPLEVLEIHPLPVVHQPLQVQVALLQAQIELQVRVRVLVVVMVVMEVQPQVDVPLPQAPERVYGPLQVGAVAPRVVVVIQEHRGARLELQTARPVLHRARGARLQLILMGTTRTAATSAKTTLEHSRRPMEIRKTDGRRLSIPERAGGRGEAGGGDGERIRRGRRRCRGGGGEGVLRAVLLGRLVT